MISGILFIIFPFSGEDIDKQAKKVKSPGLSSQKNTISIKNDQKL